MVRVMVGARVRVEVRVRGEKVWVLTSGPNFASEASSSTA